MVRAARDDRERDEVSGVSRGVCPQAAYPARAKIVPEQRGWCERGGEVPTRARRTKKSAPRAGLVGESAA